MKKTTKFTVYMQTPFGRMKRVEVRYHRFEYQMCAGKLELFGEYTPKGGRYPHRYIGSGSHVVVLDGWGHPECESEYCMASRADLVRFDEMLATHIAQTGATVVADYRNLGHAA